MFHLAKPRRLSLNSVHFYAGIITGRLNDDLRSFFFSAIRFRRRGRLERILVTAGRRTGGSGSAKPNSCSTWAISCPIQSDTLPLGAALRPSDSGTGEAIFGREDAE